MIGGANMYFPYLRGRQFELIALRELIEKDLISENIVPVIEPIKPTSTLRTTIEMYIKNQRKIALVHNPKVGNFINDFHALKDKEDLEKTLASKDIIKIHIMNSNSEQETKPLRKQLNDMAIINKTPEFLMDYLSLLEGKVPKYAFIADHARLRRNITKNKVLFEDRFTPEKKNADYKNRDVFFSDDHMHYKQDKFKGFSDYSVVGDTFSESGYAAYAVAIHIVYFDKERNLRVRSFVSDSNVNPKDPANKYYEALTYLVNCPIVKRLETYALKEFKKHHDEGAYPGLGTVKKLAIMHHLELMSNFLEGQKSN